jgi:FixJ family two-component response regulator
MVGCTDFLGKPVDSQTVLDTISKYLSKNSTEVSQPN